MQNRNIVRVEGVDREFNRLKILFVLLLPLAMSLMAVSSVNVVLHSIETGLGASSTDLQWILSGYALSFGVTLVPAGRAGDVLGRGSFFVIGLVLFILASLACGLAPNPLLLNVARVVQGFGSGIFNPQIVGMIQQYFSGGGRARAFAVFGLVISVSVAVGPIVAGGIIAALGPERGWRWAFLFNIPLGVLGIILALAWFPFGSERRRRRAKRERAAAETAPPTEGIDLDPVGSVLAALAVLCIMLPFMVRDAPWAWALLPVAVALGFAWVMWERRYKAAGHDPMVDLRLFGFRSFSYGTAVSGTMFLGAATTFVVVALYLQSGLGVDALHTGLVGLPNAVVSGVASMWAGRHVMTHGRRLVILALACMAAGTLASIVVVWAIATWGISYWWLAAPLCLNGFGMGAMGSANQTLSLADVPLRAGGTAGGVKQTVERSATAIGNAMVTGVFFAAHALSGWTTAFVAGFAVIGVTALLAMGVAIRDARYHASAGVSPAGPPDPRPTP